MQEMVLNLFIDVFIRYACINNIMEGLIRSLQDCYDIIGKYHPHGDSAAYETIVRMAHGGH